jgi:uncharacterized protein (DUF2225 family)
MTTIKNFQFECPGCGKSFLGRVLASFGYASIDENLCKEYWGYNPMLLMLIMCPHCSYVNFSSEYEKTEASEDVDLLWAPETCESYTILADKLKGDNESENYLAIGYYYHQGACCKKIEGKDPIPWIREANRYYRLAKEHGIHDAGVYDIDTLIEKTSV